MAEKLSQSVIRLSPHIGKRGDFKARLDEKFGAETMIVKQERLQLPEEHSKAKREQNSLGTGTMKITFSLNYHHLSFILDTCQLCEVMK